MLGWDGRRKNGDPDNSALHSASNNKVLLIEKIILMSILVSTGLNILGVFTSI
jgi:hypothetical protein